MAVVNHRGDLYYALNNLWRNALQISTTGPPKTARGWTRVDVLCALMNAVFLVALSLTVMIEAIIRLTRGRYPLTVHPFYTLSVGIAGLSLSIIGLLLYQTYGRGRGDGSAAVRARRSRTRGGRKQTQSSNEGKTLAARSVDDEDNIACVYL